VENFVKFCQEVLEIFKFEALPAKAYYWYYKIRTDSLSIVM